MTNLSTQAQSYPCVSRANQAVARLAALGFFLSMDISLTNLLVEPVKREMLLSDMQVGLLQGTAFGLALGLGSLPLGRLVDRWSRVWLLRVALVVWIISMVASGLAHAFLPMVIARAALGLVAALLVPATGSLIADLCPPERRSVATSMFIVGQASGQAFGILGGGFAFELFTHVGREHPDLLLGLTAWRATYLAAGAIGLLLLFIVSPLKEPERTERKQAAQSFSVAFAELWAYRIFLLPLLTAMLLVQFSLQASTVWSPTVLTRRFALTPGDFSTWLGSVLLFSGIVGAYAGGWLGEWGRKRGGRRGVLLPALLACVAVAPTAAFALAPDVPSFALLLGANMFLNVIVVTIGAVSITLNIPNEIRGLAFGANSFLSGIFSFATAPALIALLSGGLGGESKLGLALALATIPATFVAAGLLWLARRTSPAAEQEAVMI